MTLPLLGLGAVPFAADEAGRPSGCASSWRASAIVAPRIPVINNIDVRSETEPAAIRDALYRQAYGPVRWEETIRAIRARGVTDIFECGPGKVLANLTRRIDADAESVAVLRSGIARPLRGALLG